MSSLWEELLPGIPGDVTLTHVATKLPWSAVRVLSSVSRTWQRAIRSQEVYRARSRSHSTETLAVFSHIDTDLPRGSNKVISLYSMRDKTLHRIPPIPHLRGLSCCSQFVSVDGKLYANCSGWKTDFVRLGERKCNGQHGAYLLDLAAGQRQWKECPRIQEPECQCGFILGCGYSGENGPHIMGGLTHGMRGGCAHHFNSSWRHYSSVNGEWRGGDRKWLSVSLSLALQVGLDTFGKNRFVVQGEVHMIRTRDTQDGHDIFVRENDGNSWRHRHSVTFHEIALELGAALGRDHRISNFDLLFILPINNELLALPLWEMGDTFVRFPRRFLLQSRGFGTESKEIVWQKAPHSSFKDIDVNPALFAMCPIEL